MNENKINFEMEALKLKSLLTVIAGFNPDRGEALPEVLEVVKMANDIADILYCAVADGRLK